MPDNGIGNFARYQQAGWIKPDDALDACQWRSLKHALGLDAVVTWAGVVTEINRLKREAIELRGELVELRAEFEWTRNQGISLRVEVERLRDIESKALAQSETIQRDWLSPAEATGLRAEVTRLRDELSLYIDASGATRWNENPSGPQPLSQGG